MLRKHPYVRCAYRQAVAQEILRTPLSALEATCVKFRALYSLDFQLAAMTGLCGLGGRAALAAIMTTICLLWELVMPTHPPKPHMDPFSATALPRLWRPLLLLHRRDEMSRLSVSLLACILAQCSASRRSPWVSRLPPAIECATAVS